MEIAENIVDITSKPMVESASAADLSSPQAPSSESKEGSSTPKSVENSDEDANTEVDAAAMAAMGALFSALSSLPAGSTDSEQNEAADALRGTMKFMLGGAGVSETAESAEEEEMKEVPASEIPEADATTAAELKAPIQELMAKYPTNTFHYEDLTIIDAREKNIRTMYFYNEKTHQFQDLIRFYVGEREMVYVNGVILPFYTFLNFESSQTVDDVTQVYTENCSIYLQLDRVSFIHAMRYMGKYLTQNIREEEESAALFPFQIAGTSLIVLAILLYFSLFIKGWVSMLVK